MALANTDGAAIGGGGIWWVSANHAEKVEMRTKNMEDELTQLSNGVPLTKSHVGNSNARIPLGNAKS